MSITSIWAGRLHRLPTQGCCVQTKPDACNSSRRQRKQRLTWLITWEYWQTLVTIKELMMERFHRKKPIQLPPNRPWFCSRCGFNTLCCGQYNTKAKDLYTEAVNMCDSFHTQILGKPTIRGVPYISGDRNYVSEYSEIQNSVNNRDHSEECLKKQKNFYYLEAESTIMISNEQTQDPR